MPRCASRLKRPPRRPQGVQLDRQPTERYGSSYRKAVFHLQELPHQGVGRSYCYHRFEDVVYYPDSPPGPVTREMADRDVGEMLKVVEDK